jgi:hypothetical protein
MCAAAARRRLTPRNEFGRERFDRFLYEVVVTGMFHEGDRLADPELLRKTAGGCQ